MSSVRPVYEFAVSDARVAKAKTAYDNALKILGREVVMDVVHELGMASAMAYEDGALPGDPAQFILDTTNVQFCALAAALSAVVEGGGRQELSRVS
jgi:hypothetical protein